jgi:hypothetical protein
MNSSGKPADTPFAAAGGKLDRPDVTGDPYLALDELMVVVEALCPRWPDRKTFASDIRTVL